MFGDATVVGCKPEDTLRRTNKDEKEKMVNKYIGFVTLFVSLDYAHSIRKANDQQLVTPNAFPAKRRKRQFH